MSRLGLALMLLFLSLATLVQVNDPDPLVWMVIYGAPCLLTLVALVNVKVVEWHGWWMVCVGVLVGVLALYLALATPTPDQLLRWDSIITTEEGREMFGVGMVLVWLVLLSQSSRGWIWSVLLLVFGVTMLVTWTLYRLLIQPNIHLPPHCSTSL